MDIPLKPWEIPQNPAYSNGVPYIPNTNTDRLHSTAVPYPGSGGGGSATAANSAPPLPPRPGQSQTSSPYRPLYNAGGYGSYGYGNRSMMPYGSGGPMYGSSYSSPYYNPYNSYSSPMGGMYGVTPGRMYGNAPNEPSFSQLAEESSASAFQSIESFVSAFGSISAMLESTFNAVYSSFRAVVGVADHLGRVKQVLSALAIFRFFKWMMRRMLYLIGISKIKPEQIESVWNTLSAQQGDSSEWENELKPGSKPSSWPILMFLGFIFAGPYLMWKLIRSFNLNNPEAESKWASGESEHFIGVAEHDFQPGSERELGLKRNQNIRLAPASHQPANVRGWVLASDGRKTGLVPINYIKILGRRTGDPVVRPRSPNPIVGRNTDWQPSRASTTATTTLPPLPKITPELQEQPQPQQPNFTTASNNYLHLRPAILSTTAETNEQDNDSPQSST